MGLGSLEESGREMRVQYTHTCHDGDPAGQSASSCLCRMQSAVLGHLCSKRHVGEITRGAWDQASSPSLDKGRY
jgi:hypothetical protein